MDHLVCPSLRTLAALLTALLVLPAGGALAQTPSIEGTCRLVSRTLPDGTVQRPPAVVGLQTYTKTYRNFNILSKDPAPRRRGLPGRALRGDRALRRHPGVPGRPRPHAEAAPGRRRQAGQATPTAPLSGVDPWTGSMRRRPDAFGSSSHGVTSAMGRPGSPGRPGPSCC